MPVALLLAAALTYPAFDAATNRALARAPAEIGRYAERRAECNHWGGEPGWDKARQAQIDKAMRDLKCD
jgi:hypothetical protein